MSKDSKRFKEAKKAVEVGKVYTPLEAAKLLKSLETANFDETVEVHLKLGVNPRHADQQVRGTCMLPHGTGKTVRVAVFAKGEKATEATWPEKPEKLRINVPVAASHSLTLLSAAPVKILLPSGDQAGSDPPCLVSARRSPPPALIRSICPERLSSNAMVRPSGDHAA